MLTHRLATNDDVPALTALMTAAIDVLQNDVLDPAQVAASHALMGLDTTLIDDGTYYVIEADGQLAGCGGWSRRATLYGGNHTAGRSDAALDPRVDAARVRAMYTQPGFTRQGVGRLILTLCEEAARSEGFRRLELMATLAGRPLYASYGFQEVEELVDTTTGTAIPLVRMAKAVS